ncbi:MAG: PilZ domain-containing protein [Desulfobacterales bacterium]
MIQRVYVDQTHQVKVICPKCGLEKNIDVFKFKDTHKRLKANCKCGEVFRFALNFRKHFRKKVMLSGEYFNQEKNERDDIFIKDISISGINFITFKEHNFSKDDTVELKLALDDETEPEIHASIRIKWINDRNVGGQFINPKSLEKDLKLFLR